MAKTALVLGAFQTWTRDSGVAVQWAIASGSSVPRLFPPVEISGRSYQDGGVRSTTNGDLAFPEEGAQEAMGINRMDSSRRGLCVDAGREQGRSLAGRIAAWAQAAA